LGVLRLAQPWLLGLSEVRDAIQQGVTSKGGSACWIDENVFQMLPMIADRLEERSGAVGRMYRRDQVSLWNSCCSWASPERRSRELLGDARERADRPNWALLNRPSATELVVLIHALTWCWRWGGEDEDSISSLKYSEKALLCTEIVFQLQELDWWLDVHGGAEAACIARKLYTESLLPENLGSEGGEGQASLSNEDGVRSLLIYRATLMGLNLALAADNSMVSGTELGRRVVRVL